MATSGTINFAPTLVDIMEEAYERATGGELRFGYQVQSMRRSLNLLLLDWLNSGYNLWQLKQATVVTVAGTATVNLATDCVDIMEVMVFTGSNNEIPLTRISVTDYATLANKTASGRPVNILVRRENSPVTLTMWPVPDQVYTLSYWYLRRPQDAGDGNNTQDVPIRFISALIAGLALYTARKVPEGEARIPRLEMDYANALDAAQREDRDKTPVAFQPFIGRI